MNALRRSVRPVLYLLAGGALVLAGPALADGDDAADAGDEAEEVADADTDVETNDGDAEGTEAVPKDDPADADDDPVTDDDLPPPPMVRDEPRPFTAPPVDTGRRFRRAEGFIIRLEGGHTYWRLDGDRIQEQINDPAERPNVDPLLVDRTQDAPAAVLHMGYNVLGHATVGFDVTATGWDVQTRDRGGAGFAALTVAWHPVELLAELLPIGFIRDRFWDVSFFAGGGYGVLGQDRAIDGLHLAFGGRAEVFPARWISIGATVRQYPLRFDRYVIHWDHEIDQNLPNRSGGSVLIPTVTLAFRVPPGG